MDDLLHCQSEQRREDVRNARLYGLDYLEVSDDSQVTLLVYFLGKAPEHIQAANVRIAGGQRIQDIRVTRLNMLRQPDPTLDDVMEVTVDRYGDFSTYTLSVVEIDQAGRATGNIMPGFDTRYGTIPFSFKASCPSDLDCKSRQVCPPPLRSEPDINYLAKDYASFRQLMLDRLALIMPDWQETHVADLGIVLVEALAYTGDYLSYYQDAVATEAYLATARQRISVRRHARLVDYRMHDGCNARAWLSIHTDTDRSFDASQASFITAYPGAPRDKHILTAQDLVNVPANSYETFEPLAFDGNQTLQLYVAHNEIQFYTWGDCECCLASGATSATLRDQWARGSADAEINTDKRMLQLKVGDVLIFEEVIGPRTGNPADADPGRRQAVRLTEVAAGIDPLYRQPVVAISWGPEDALAFPLCLSAQAPPPECNCLENVSVARGNVVLVDHGLSIDEVLGQVPLYATQERCPGVCDPADILVTPGRFRPVLQQHPLTFSQPAPPQASACALLAQQVRQALPALSLDSIAPAPDGSKALFAFSDMQDPTNLGRVLHDAKDQASQALLARLTPATRQALAAWDPGAPLPASLFAALAKELDAMLQNWSPARDLLDSEPGARNMVVETDNDAAGHVRFAETGTEGAMAPPAGMLFEARYRVGNGRAGNVGAETITYLVLRSESWPGAQVAPRNPMAACGGIDPEAVADVKLFAPHAFRKTLARAITADDYATLAARNPRLQRAAATLRWTGSWYEVLVAIDPLCTEQADPVLLAEITSYLERFRRIGHDLVVKPAQYVPLDVELKICVKPHYLRAQVEAALLDIFSNRLLPDGKKGLFHPDNQSFGNGIYASSLVAAAQAVPGVQEVEILKLERYFEGPNDELQNGVLQLGPLEVAQLDNNASLPENGRLAFDMRGGR